MKIFAALLLTCLIFHCENTIAQTGPWAKYDAKMKGEALIRESDGGYLKEIKSIVEGGGDVNWQMEGTGLTPLMAASSGGHTEVVRFLLAQGAKPELQDAYGRTAYDRAKLAKATTVMAVLTPLTKNPIPPPKKLPPVNPPVKPPVIPTPSPVLVSLKNAPKVKLPWAPFGSFKAGDKVAFFNGSWHTGTVLEVGAPGDYKVKNVAAGERKYLIAREGAPNWNDWTNWGSVTGIVREKYWTDFFLGDWCLGETMAVNTHTDGNYERDEYSFHGATEALQVNADNSYKWKTIDKKIITGKWIAATDGAGIILLKAYRGKDWTLRNETNAAEENIRGLQSARLTTDGVMSVTAKRGL
ncbi:MAG: Ankyrin repeat-containing protein [Ferruginibacter sp.]|nr:Ankyrin repeat-containing protein [Ferruginibacter sp.]